MLWIESHLELDGHPKVLHLMELSGLDIDQVLGKLHRFWYWCATYAEDGDMRRHGIEAISRKVGLRGADLITTRFIDIAPYLRVHDWWHYIGRFLQSKYKHTPAKWQRVRDLYAGAQLDQPTLPPLPGSMNGSRNGSDTNPKNPTTETETLTGQDNINVTTPRRNRKRSGIPDPRVSVLLKDFYERLQTKLGEKPESFNGGAAGRIFSKCLRDYPPEQIVERMKSWFDSSDPFIVKNGWRVELFGQNFNTLKGGPIDAQTNRAGGGYFGAPSVASKYAALGHRPKHAG